MMSVRLFVYRFRRPLAGASAALAVLILASLIRPAQPPMTDLVVAATDLPAGATLTAADLDRWSVPVDYSTPGALVDPEEAVGGTISSALAAGEVITRSRLVSASTLPAGLHAVPVRLAVADLLTPGTTIDLVLISGDRGGDGTGDVVAQGVQVVTVPRPESSAGLGSPERRAGSLIVVATDRRTAITLAAVGSQPGLGVVLR
jgi:pilus assembly protein CpaB